MITVLSDPAPAVVTVDGDYRLTTPSKVALTRGRDHRLVFHRDGYDDLSVHLTRSSSGWVIGNLLVGGVVGAASDVATGSAYELTHESLSGDTLRVRLTPTRQQPGLEPPPASPPADGRPSP